MPLLTWRWIIATLTPEVRPLDPPEDESDELRRELARRILREPNACGRPGTLDGLINRAWAYLAQGDSRRAVTELRQLSDLTLHRYPGALKVMVLALQTCGAERREISHALAALGKGFGTDKEHRDDIRALAIATDHRATHNHNLAAPA